MAIPTAQDRALAEVDALHGVILTRLRTFIRAGERRDPADIRAALQSYVDAAIALVKSVDQ